MNAPSKKSRYGLFGWEHEGGWVTDFVLFPLSASNRSFFFFSSQPLPPIYLPPPTNLFVSTYLPPSYLTPISCPHSHPLVTSATPLSLSMRSHSSFMVLLLFMLLPLTLDALAPSVLDTFCSHSWCSSFSLLMLLLMVLLVFTSDAPAPNAPSFHS
jgi:hypothetical protein